MPSSIRLQNPERQSGIHSGRLIKTGGNFHFLVFSAALCKAFHDFQEISGYSKIVELKDILKSRKPDLNPKSHTAVLEVPMALDLEEARQELIKIEGKRLAVLTDILDLLEEMKTE